MYARLKQNIDQGWKFCRGAALNAEQMDFDASRWANVNLPHDWSIEGPIDEGNPGPMGFHPQGTGWYRKELVLDESFAGRSIFLEFEGIFRNSTLWVNGGKIGVHPYGYTGVVYDITRYVRCDGRSNVIVVKIDCPPAPPYWPGWGWWYEGCGIYRHVWVIATDALHVAQWGTFVSTPRVTESQATVRARTTLQNDGHAEQQCLLRTILQDAKGKNIAVLETAGTVAPKARVDFTQETALASPQLWSPDSPCLYLARTEVVCDGKTVDTYETPFGIRWFEFMSDRGFFLNGKHLQLRGWNIHNDFGGLGIALPDRANYKTVEAAKEAGCNFFRCAHHDESPSLMDACDRLGMLVWGENRYLGPAETSLPPLRDLIRRNRNHPSIICWGLGNTAGWQDGDMTETHQLRACSDVAHEEDPTRPTAFAREANADAIANGFAFVTDIAGYNGNGQGIDDRDHDRHPNLKCMISETNGPAGARGVYEERHSPDSREGLRFVVQPGGWLYRCSTCDSPRL